MKVIDSDAPLATEDATNVRYAKLSAWMPGPAKPRAPTGASGTTASNVVDVPVRLATVNDAQVEEVSAPQDVVVQVMQFEEGGPTFILVDDPSGSGVPL